MKNNYAWALIVLVLVVAAGAIWFTMNKTNATLDNATATTTPVSSTGAKHTTGSMGKTSATGSTGTVTSGDIRPVITSITPDSAKVGDIVTVKGVNFDATSNNVVTFGPSKGLHKQDGTADNQVAALPAANGNTVTFKVPSAIESGTLCTQAGTCANYGPTGTAAGTYMVTVVNKNGLSTEFPFTVTN